MADATAPETTPLHDGWSSRKVVMASVLTGVLLALCSAAVVLDKATFAEASSFMNWAIGSVWVPLVLGLSLDKLAAIKLKALGGP